jgi:HTH-type transcriptional regulator/antitoxin HigA
VVQGQPQPESTEKTEMIEEHIASADSAALSRAWRDFQSSTPVRIAPPRTEAEFSALSALMNDLLDEIGDDAAHPDFDLLDLVTTLVEAYEAEHIEIPDAPPAEVLAVLMREHGLIQNDLRVEFGAQSVVSAVLNGRRKISAAQAKALGRRFSVSPAVFL